MGFHECQRWKKYGMPCPLRLFDEEHDEEDELDTPNYIPLAVPGEQEERAPRVLQFPLAYPNAVMGAAEELVARKAAAIDVGGLTLREAVNTGSRVVAGVAGAAAIGAGVFQIYRSGGFGGHLFPSMFNPNKPSRRFKLGQADQSSSPAGGPSHV